MTAMQMPLSSVESLEPSSSVLQHRAQAQPYATGLGYLWMLLTSAALCSGVIFGIYGIFRVTWPDAFQTGQQFLDRGWETLITAVLLLGSVMMVQAVRSARRGDRFNLMLFICLTLMCGICFLGITTIEFKEKSRQLNLNRPQFAPRGPHIAAPLATTPAGAGRSAPDAAAGEKFYNMVCAACHGRSGEGVTALGVPLRDSPLAIGMSQQELSQFIKVGRTANDPKSRMNAAMPPRGGAAFLSDANVEDIAAYMKRNIAQASDNKPSAAPTAPPAADVVEEAPTTFIVPPTTGPKGLKTQVVYEVPREIVFEQPAGTATSRQARSFLTFYFVFSGFHALWVVAALGVVAWLFHIAITARRVTGCREIVDTAALYWHVVTATWILMIPLFHI